MLNSETNDYINSHTTPGPELLYRLYRETNLKTVYPRMVSGHFQGRLLSMFSKLINPTTILEIGTFTGYATICLAEGLRKGGTIHTIEAEPEMQDIFVKYFIEAGIHDNVIIHTGKALDIIPEINTFFDLVFMDADKDNYLNYYQMIFAKIRPGGVLIADNALWGGKVVNNHRDKETRGIIAFNDFVQNDTASENILLPVRDGLMIIRKIS